MPSSSEMICTGRIFGAPLTVPAGNVARIRSLDAAYYWTKFYALIVSGCLQHLWFVGRESPMLATSALNPVNSRPIKS